MTASGTTRVFSWIGGLSLVALLTFGSNLQLAAEPQQNEPAQDRRPATAQAREESRDYYRKWLNQDVVYIITPEEQEVFLALTTPEERDNFIEQFWLRRDSEPDTAENEFKLEHYRRIVYSNERFSAGIPGWKTDRGRIYIKFGPPDRIESMPAGGHYHRERKEGGGHTSVFPYERWEYRHIPGVGEDIELEFVDDGGGGLYQLTYDPQRKDELIHSGFMGPTWDEVEDYETTGARLKQYRVAGRRYAGDLPAPYRYTGGFETEKDQPFSKLILSASLNRAPEIKFTDLETVVKTNVYYQLVPFHVATGVLRVSEKQGLATVTVEIPHSALTFKDQGGVMSAKAEILGQVSTLTRRIRGAFEETVSREIPASQFPVMSRASSVFQKHLLLGPGVYKLNLVVKDVETGNLGTWEGRLEVPGFAAGQLGLSSIVLAQEIAPSDPSQESLFDLGTLKVVPRVSRTFRQDEPMGFFLQVYPAAIEQSTGRPDLKVEFAVAANGEKPEQWRDCSRLAVISGEHSTVARLTSLEPYPPGEYALLVRAQDRITGEIVQASVPFRVVPPREAPK